MMTRTSILGVALAAIFAAACNEPTVIDYKPPPGHTEIESEPIELEFEPSRVEAVSGQVVKVEPLQVMAGTRHGVRIQLESAAGAYSVYLAPQRFLERHDMLPVVGEEVTVVGSVHAAGGRKVVIARTIARGEASLHVRDEGGIPMWGRWARRRNV
jgi:hypothetical protein